MIHATIQLLDKDDLVIYVKLGFSDYIIFDSKIAIPCPDELVAG
jgi:hypothetical protein